MNIKVEQQFQRAQKLVVSTKLGFPSLVLNDKSRRTNRRANYPPRFLFRCEDFVAAGVNHFNPIAAHSRRHDGPRLLVIDKYATIGSFMNLNTVIAYRPVTDFAILTHVASSRRKYARAK